MKRRGRRLAVLLAIAVLAPLAGAPSSSAADKKAEQKKRQQEISKELSRLRDQVEDATAEEAALLDQIDEVKARRAVLDQKLAGIDGQIRNVTGQLRKAEAKVDELDAEVAVAERLLKGTSGELDQARVDLTERAINAYVGQTDNQAAAVVLETETLRDLAARVSYMRAVVGRQQEEVDAYAALKGDLEVQKAGLEVKRAAVQQQRDVVARHRSDLVAVRKEEEAARQEVLKEEAEEARLLEQVRSRLSEYEGRIAQLKKESDAIATLLRGVQAGQGIAPSGRGILAMPIPGARITSRFGPRVHPIHGTVRVHTGIDLGSPAGTPIRAAADGVVAFSGARGGYGNTVILDHGKSLATLYAHQSQILVSAGKKVKKGDVIGKVGSTGFSTGPHLHFEVRVAGSPVDPLAYL